MSFEKLEKDELLKIAEAFGVEVNANSRPATIAKRLEEDGVTWDMAKEQVPELGGDFEEAEEEVTREVAEEKAKEPQVLVKMDRANQRYDVRGFTFTQQNPFAIMPESDALWVVRNVEGFRRAVPEEAEEFYG